MMTSNVKFCWEIYLFIKLNMNKKKMTVKSKKSISITTDIILKLWDKTYLPNEVYKISKKELNLIKNTHAFQKGKIKII